MPNYQSTTCKRERGEGLHMFEFPRELTFHLGNYIDEIVNWLTVHWVGFFDAIKSGLLWIFIHLNDFLTWLPWWYLILVVFLLACQYKSVGAGVLYSVFLLLIGMFGLWEAVETERYFKTVLRYIHQNPLKANLVKYIFECQWTSLKE